MTEDSGETATVPSTPKISATASGPDRNPQAEMPAARATTSSEERVSRQKAMMPPSRMAKGRICSATKGSRSPAMVRHQAEVGIRPGGGAAQQLDEVEQRDQQGQPGQHGEGRRQEAPRDIAA